MSTLVEIECFGVVGPNGRLELLPDSGYILGPRSLLEQINADVPARLVAVSIVYDPLPPTKTARPPKQTAPRRAAAGAGSSSSSRTPSRRRARSRFDGSAASQQAVPVDLPLGQASAFRRGFDAACAGGEFSNPYVRPQAGYQRAYALGWTAGRTST